MKKILKLPTVIDGVPYCNENTCPAFDGKRCEILGHQPGNLCEPSVREVVAAVADLKDRLRLLAPFICKSCGCAPVEIVTGFGELEDTEFCEDCLRTPQSHWHPNALDNPLDEWCVASVSRFCRAVAGRRLVP